VEKLQAKINRLELELTDYKLKLNRVMEDAKKREEELIFTHDFAL
jgi:hypothetical protein